MRGAVLADGWDRAELGRQLARGGALSEARDRAARLLPEPDGLVADLFFALYKLNVVVRPPEELAAGALLNRRLLEAVLASDALPSLRERTRLCAPEAAAGAAVLTDRALAALLREYRVDPAALASAADAGAKEEELAALDRLLAHLDALPPGAFGDAAEALEAERARVEAALAKDRAAVSELAAKLTSELDRAVDLRLSQLPEQLDAIDSELSALGLAPPGRRSAAPSLELGERLLASKKLRLIARLTGALRDLAARTRARRVARASEELHAIGIGADLERLLPTELVALRGTRRALHADFLRRFAERRLLEYRLAGRSRRGPMIVLVDTSGSMSGSKEIWAKAVGLTLMDIARRERRACHAILFSAGEQRLELELLARRARHAGRAKVLAERVQRFAECFFGGGTSFEEPLDRALELVTEGELRRGDLVFISDGEASVSDALLERVARAKKRHRVAIRSVLVGEDSSGTLARISDAVWHIRDLAGEEIGALFGEV